MTQEDLLNVKFEPKNQSKASGGNPLSEISSARALEVVAQTDMIEKTRSGVNAGQFIGFDPLTRTTAKKQIGFGDVYAGMDHANDNANQSVIVNRAGVSSTEAYDSKKTMANFDAAKQLSNYIKKVEPTLASKLDNIENWLFQRTAIMAHLMNKRVKLAMPGNFQLTSGFNINLNAPNFGRKIKGEDKKEKLDELVGMDDLKKDIINQILFSNFLKLFQTFFPSFSNFFFGHSGFNLFTEFFGSG